MKGREIRRRYQAQSRRFFRRILGIYRQFKKKYYYIKKRHQQKNKEKKELTNEKLDKDLDNYFKNNQEKKENEKDADVEMKEKNN